MNLFAFSLGTLGISACVQCTYRRKWVQISTHQMCIENADDFFLCLEMWMSMRLLSLCANSNTYKYAVFFRGRWRNRLVFSSYSCFWWKCTQTIMLTHTNGIKKTSFDILQNMAFDLDANFLLLMQYTRNQRTQLPTLLVAHGTRHLSNRMYATTNNAVAYQSFGNYSYRRRSIKSLVCA